MSEPEEESKPPAEEPEKDAEEPASGTKRPASSEDSGPKSKQKTVPALQQQIQQQLQAQLQAQLSAAAARGAPISPAQIQAQAQAMVQAAAQAQAVVAAAKTRGNWGPMNSQQISTLSQIQAQAIVNARHKRAPVEESDTDDSRAQTQIQLQAQALVHAHTQAQIQAGIYKGSGNEGDDSSKTKSGATAFLGSTASATIPVSITTGVVSVPDKPIPNTEWLHLPTADGRSPNGLLAGVADNQPPLSQQQFEENLRQSLDRFWRDTLASTHKISSTQQTEHDFKNHNDLPLARIKRIMKSDEDVRMISAEAPVLLAKACEWFILDVSIRAFCYSVQHKRRTLQKEDVKEAIQKTDIFDFLVDVIQ